VCFDRTERSAQLKGYLFVKQSGYHQAEDFELPRRECRNPRADLSHVVALPATICGSRDRLSYGIQQGMILKWLRQKVDCAPFHCLNPHGDVAISGDEYDLLDSAPFRQLSLKRQPIKARQSDI
jgi:hypothetical protein